MCTCTLLTQPFTARCHMPRILIADDSRFQIDLLSRSLEQQGFEVASALDALQAWMTALRASPDAIVLDINMPAGSGIEVLKRLKGSAKTRHIPVVVVSGNSEPAIEERAKRVGAAAFFHKPVDPVDLCDTLAFLLSKGRHSFPAKDSPTSESIPDTSSNRR
jgi:CheY-like chemotaxis protein